jgi:Flp pilus assembly protein TadD
MNTMPMTVRLRRICQAAAPVLNLLLLVWSQESSSVRYGPLRADLNNASIEGRITLPSGRSASLNIKVILSNSQNALSTIYTNKHGEFRFTELSEGVYYVQAVGDPQQYEPVSEMVRLGRGQIARVTLTLRPKEEIVVRKPGAQVVSAAEFDQRIPAAARKEYDAGMKLVSKGRLQESLARLQRAVMIYPDYLIAHNDLGAQYLKLKRLDEAAAQFLLALEKNPKYFNSRFNLGLALIEQKNYADAIIQLRQAVSLDSSRPAAHLWLGIALLQTGELPGAERELSKALIMGGLEFVVAHYHLAQVYLKRDDALEATRALRAYLEEAPKGEYAGEAKLQLKKLEQR